MRTDPPVLVTTFATLIAAHSALGHHSVAQFDVERVLSLNAVVAEFEWANPHVYIQLETVDSVRAPEHWIIEAGPPNLMARAGWSAESLVVGETVTAAVHPLHRGGRKIALGNSITKEDGTTLPIRGAALPAELSTPDRTSATGTDDIFSRWSPVWDPELAGAFLAPETAWAITEAGRDAVESYVISDNPSKDCIFEEPPFSMIWPSVIDIESDGDVVRLRFELLPDRMIHMNEPNHEKAQQGPGGALDRILRGHDPGCRHNALSGTSQRLGARLAFESGQASGRAIRARCGRYGNRLPILGGGSRLSHRGYDGQYSIAASAGFGARTRGV